ncbi:hypothetical protein PPTG_21217 [Phytophthora nicotianae INRA-310]|uniref:Uncharacterized protein n=1 Tax=Phytophthora nicotianae (strain INRA-310) TaxID=761204 RepID=W2R476_PHYN3|nr:hypothetical protein PPTG_21217 [Phytophthora nicotianae INRA-310]ETN20066.1 hypothetical protein PPTG_21217 [Phytophthora nicotianae INRA-310]
MNYYCDRCADGGCGDLVDGIYGYYVDNRGTSDQADGNWRMAASASRFSQTGDALGKAETFCHGDVYPPGPCHFAHLPLVVLDCPAADLDDR